MDKWISVNDRLPEYNLYVLCRCNPGFDIVMYRSFKRQRWNEDHDVTHWMYLPDPPK